MGFQCGANRLREGVDFALAGLGLSLALAPERLDIVEDSSDLIRSQRFAKSGHRTLESGVVPASVLDSTEKGSVAVVPGVAGGIVGRRRIGAVGVLPPRIGLSLPVRTMTGGTVRKVQSFTTCGVAVFLTRTATCQ